MPAQTRKPPRKSRGGIPPTGKYAPTAWGRAKEAPVAAEVDLTVPSGQTCRVRTVGIEGLVEAGILQHVDSLSALVSSKFIREVDGVKMADLKGLSGQEKELGDVRTVIQKVAVYCVIEPELQPLPEWSAAEGEEPEEREPALIYVDAVEETDLMFIFQYVLGGTRDLEQFRAEFEATLASMELGEDVPLPAQ